MMRQLFNISNNMPFVLACSGGVDSMAVADFYRRGGKKFTAAYFNHGTAQAQQMSNVVMSFVANSNNDNISFVTSKLNGSKPKGLSPEEYWRNERYSWLYSVAKGRPIVTCHHLDDVCETYLFGSINGNPKTINPVVSNVNQNTLVFRPFLLSAKSDMIAWCRKHNVSWAEDLSNIDVSTPRNRIRHNIMKEVLKINPGFHKVIKKKIVSNYNEFCESTKLVENES